MKKILLTTTVFLVTLFAVAQSPNLLNYQGVARSAVGNVLPSQPIGLRLTILSGGPTGAPVYSETRNVTTNAFGLFNAQVGSPGAITTTGTIAGVNWTAFGAGSGTKFLQVEIDPIGGTNYFNVGSTQLVSVPYALYAVGAAPVGLAGGDLTGTYPNPQLLFPLIKTFSFPTSQLIGMTNSATTGTLGAITGSSASTDANASAITGTMSSTSPGGFSAAVRGVNNGTSGLGIGVYGSHAGSGWGVYGTAPNGFGVNGNSNTSTGVNGSSISGVGVAGSSTNAAGIFGTSNTNNAGSFQNTNAANTASTIVSNNNGSGASVEGTNTGTGRGGFFQVLNAASTADAVRAETNGTGASWSIRAVSSGTNGSGLFQQTNAANTANNVQSNQGGLGLAGLFQNTNAANTANALEATTVGTGFAVRAASTNASPKALFTAGALQLTGIGEANNLILKSDAAGNANWAIPGSVGIATGTGTLNFVPKWTPNGTNLGNSKIFDDGTFVGIGTTSPGAGLVVSGNGIWNSAIGIQNTGTGMEWRMNINGNTFGVTKIPDSAFTPLRLFSTGGMDFSNSAGTSIARLLNNGNVGIGDTTPTAKFHLNGTFRYVDGTQGSYKLLHGDANGNVSWVKPNVINVSDFGAIPDDDINDAAAIESAVLYAYQNKYSTVLFPAGRYISTADSITLRSNIHYTGYGAEIVQTVPNTCIFYADTVSNVTIEGLSFTGLGTDYNGSASSSGYLPRRPCGIYIIYAPADYLNHPSSNVKVINCNFKHFAHSAIYTHDINDVWIENNKIIGIPQLVAGDNHNFGINLSSRTKRATVINNHIDSVAQGIVAQDGADNLTITGNRITDVTGQHGIYLSAASNSTISNNILLRMANNGILMPNISYNTVPMENNVVSGNIITDAQNFGISISLFDSTTRLRRFNISNNIVKNRTWNPGADAISLKDMDSSIVSGNVTNGHRYGLRLSNVKNMQVSNHSIYGSNEDGIRVDGPLTDNIKFDNVNLFETARNGQSNFGIHLVQGRNITLNNVEARDTLLKSVYSLYVEPTVDQTTLSVRNSKFLNTPVRFEPSQNIAEYSSNITSSFYNFPVSVTADRPLVNGKIYGNFSPNGGITIEGTKHATKTNSYLILQPTEGKVGINLTNPLYPLDVNGTIRGGNFEVDGNIRFNRPAPVLVYTAGYTQPISIEAANISLNTASGGNVGIGNAAPTAKLQVSNGNASVSAQVEQTSGTNANNAMFINNVNAISGPAAASLQGGAGLYVRKGPGSALAFPNPSATISSINTASGIAVLGLSDGANSFGVAGVTNGAGGTAVFGQAQAPNSVALNGFAAGGITSKALLTMGNIQLTGIGEAAGRVLTTDAGGNATWQDLITPDVHMSAATFAGLAVPPNTLTNITTQWGGLDEGGGANYNPVTGEYTISVSGYYSVFLHLVWNDNAPSSGASSIYGQISVNGVDVARAYSSTSVSGAIPNDDNAQIERRFNTGDVIRFAVNQNTSGIMNLVTNSNACKFGIHLIHK